MSRKRTGKPPSASHDGWPVRRGSNTHRLLELIARAAAEQLGGADGRPAAAASDEIRGPARRVRKSQKTEPPPHRKRSSDAANE